MCQEAVDAIKALDVAGASCINLITFKGNPPRVVAEFATVDEAHTFHRALIQCGEAARYMEAVEQADSSR